MSDTTRKMVSSDSHVVEPPDLWSALIDPAFRDRAPRLVSESTGDWWYSGDLRLMTVTGGTSTGVRFEGQEKLKTEARFSEVRPGAYMPQQKLADMDADGVYGEVVYPTLGLMLQRIPDSDLLSAISRCYNDWLAEFCRASRARVKGVAMINLDDVNTGIAELERSAGLGLAGAMISVYPDDAFSYDRARYEPFWAAVQDAGIPLSLHIGTNRGVPQAVGAIRASAIAPLHPFKSLAAFATSAHWVQMSIANMIFSGVFERFPRLKVVSLEHEIAWAPYFMNSMDFNYTQRALRQGWYRFKGSTLPSDFFRRNVHISFQEDGLGLTLRSHIGVDNLMWGSDYPHPEGTFPRSQRILSEIFQGIPQDEQRKLAGDNTARLYGVTDRG